MARSRTSQPTTRLLAVLELLQARGRLGGAELADRIGVDRRTIRRYIARLEELGIPVTTGLGVHGGYELVAGYKLPPLMLTNDEALAVSLGLLAARGIGLVDGRPALASAQAKLERVLPAEIRRRVRAVHETVSLEQPNGLTPGDNATLAGLSTAAQDRQGVRMHYRARSGERTERDFDPYGLAYRGRRWYVVGHCHERRGLRTFRLDRIERVVAQPRTFARPDGFDALDAVNRALATLPRAFAVEVLLHTDLLSARRALYPALGLLEPREDGVCLRGQVDDLAWFARELARLPWRFEIRKPRALVAALRQHAERLTAAATASTRRRGS